MEIFCDNYNLLSNYFCYYYCCCCYCYYKVSYIIIIVIIIIIIIVIIVTIIILLLFNYMIRFSNFHIVWRKAKAPGTVSRLERPGNFSGSKTNFIIKTCWILAESLAHKLVSFALSTDSFVVSFLKSLKRWSWIWCGKRG